MISNIETMRLILIPITLEITNELLGGEYTSLEKLGINRPDAWPTSDTMDILPIIQESLKISKIPSGFETWMIVKKENKKVIGDIGFFGKPSDKNEVEMGYGLVEEEWEKGYGYEATKELIDWALLREDVDVIKASCLIINRASERILEKCGMKELMRDQESIYWELRK